MKENTFQTPTNRLVDLTLKEIQDYEANSIDTTDYVSFSQYQKVQEIKTQQNGGFLTSLGEGQTDDRESYDIITPMVETGIANIDIDTSHLDPYIENEHEQAHGYIAKSLLNHFFNQTNHGEKINDQVESFIDDGNVVTRKIDDDGEIYDEVDLQNLYVIDQSAKTLEDTTVIEKNVMNQTKLNKMKGWENIDKVIQYGNVGKSKEIPSYEVFYRYGEVTRDDLEWVKNQLHGTPYEENEDNKTEYVTAMFVMVRAKMPPKDRKDMERRGIPVFIEELKGETIEISKKLKVKKYKPYEEAHFGKYSGTWLRKGYRWIGIPYQNRANELGNQIREVMKHLKFVYWSKDEKIAGKNILSSIRNGQIINTEHLEVLNNQFPNLNIYAEEWNRNIRECEKALKAFEVASGEATQASMSATAVAVSSQQVGKFYGYKQEKLGLYFSSVYKRWVIPELLKNTDTQEKIEIIGDAAFLEEYVDAIVSGQMLKYMFDLAMTGGMLSAKEYNMFKELKKEELLKNKRHFLELEKDFFKDVAVYVGINPTGEIFNKQNKITNGLKAVEYLSNEMVMRNPLARDVLLDVIESIGVKVDAKKMQVPEEMATQAQAQMPRNNAPALENNKQEKAIDAIK